MTEIQTELFNENPTLKSLTVTNKSITKMSDTRLEKMGRRDQPLQRDSYASNNSTNDAFIDADLSNTLTTPSQRFSAKGSARSTSSRFNTNDGSDDDQSSNTQIS